jgi:hypothetical protein
MRHSDLEDFIGNLNAYPGFKFKIVNLYNHLRQLSLERHLGARVKPHTTTKLRKPRSNMLMSRGSARSGLISPTNISVTGNNKPKSVQTFRSNNKIVTSFMNSGGFGFKYYLEDNNANINKINKEDNIGSNNIKPISSKDNKNITIGDKNDIAKANNTKPETAKHEQLNEEIDKLLSYYMTQLNEKVDNSVNNSIDDDSSLENFQSIEKYINKNNFIQREDAIDIREDISEIKRKNNQSPSTALNNMSSVQDILLERHSTSAKTNNNIVIGNNISSFTNTNYITQIDNLNPNNDNIDEEINLNSDKLNIKIEDGKKNESESDSYIPELEIDNIEEEIAIIQKKENNTVGSTNIINEEKIVGNNFKQNSRISSARDNIRIQSAKQSAKGESNRVLSGKVGGDKIEELPKQESDTNININNNLINKPTSGKKVHRYEDDNDDYSDIRLTKSCEEGYIRQNIDHFDIEYMCRCLGLALMKHLESAKDNQHILDLINGQEKFSFFSSIYNTNFSFIANFFNFESQTQKISNLDRLDLQDYEKRENDKPISYVSHMTNEKIVEKEEKIGKNIFRDFDINVNMINDYFKNNPKNMQNRYKNITDNTKNILLQDLNAIKEVDSIDYINQNMLGTVQHNSGKADYIDILRESVVLFAGKEDDDVAEDDGEEGEDESITTNTNPNNKHIDIESTPFHKKADNNTDNKFCNYNIHQDIINNQLTTDDNGRNIHEALPEEEKDCAGEVFESGTMESNYLIDVTTTEKLKSYLLKSVELYDDDYDYLTQKLNPHRRYVNPPDPQVIFEFCANIMILSKMEKEVIIIALIYIERFIFNTGLLLTSRNWKRVLFTSMIVASKIWDDDSFENNHFAQVFTHLTVGEINMLERIFLELINYKVYVKCSDYFKYFFIIKSIALKYNFDGFNLVPMSVERMMKLQEYAYLTQKKLRKKYSYNNSAEF